MAWLTNSVTWVRCDDSAHNGDPGIKLETGFQLSAGQALAANGWTYNRARGFHRCPACTALYGRSN